MEKRTVGKIQSGVAQRLIHGNKGGSKPAYPRLVSKGLLDGLPQNDAHILYRVMAVHMEIAPGGQLQPEFRVESQRRQHMVKETDSGVNLDGPAVQIQGQRDLSLLCITGDPGRTAHISFPPQNGLGWNLRGQSAFRS